MAQAYIFYRSVPDNGKNKRILRNLKAELRDLHNCGQSTPYWVYRLSPYEEPTITKISTGKIFHPEHLTDINSGSFSSDDEGIAYVVYCSFGRKKGEWFVKGSAEGAKIILNDKLAGETFAYEVVLRQKRESVRRIFLEDLISN